MTGGQILFILMIVIPWLLAFAISWAVKQGDK